MKHAVPMCGCLILVVAFAGCVSRATHEIPYTRNYADLEKVPYEEARAAVEKAHRVGAQHHAPYPYFSSASYIKIARDEKSENDLPGTKDYSKLAKEFAEKAIAEGSGIADKGAPPMPESKAACQAEFDRLRARFQELDRCKAILVAPVLYAHIETALSWAEHELLERAHYPEAARIMVTIEPDIDTIWSQDVDGDGIIDMKDGHPWAPEDKDGYEDEDGIPEPKPYPVLDAIHFAIDSSKLTDDAKGYLRGIAHMLVDGYSEAKLYVDAHTDNTATEEYNMGLSQRREMAVCEYLNASGAKKEMVVGAHHGESKPIADNSTKEGRAKNRRAELKLDSPDVKSPYCQ